MEDDLKLKQSNNLILATHKMNIQQMRLFFYACSQYRGDLDIEVNLDAVNRVLTEDTGNRGGNQRELVKNSIPTLMRNGLVHIDDEDGERWSVAITDSYIKKDGETVRFTFNKSVQRELEELRGYTYMYLSNLTGMTSTYSVRLYEFFAMRLGSQNAKGKFDFDIIQLRSYLNCIEKHKMFKNFEARVLKQAEEEINAKTNIKMSYTKIKTGRKITSIEFLFAWKNRKDIIDVDVKKKASANAFTKYEQTELDEFLKNFE